MKSFHSILGQMGEEYVIDYLKKKHKFKIIEINYKTPCGEIDIIAMDKKTMAFVEVKTRSSTDYGDPSEAVDKVKQRRIFRSAEYYLSGSTKKPKAKEYRFDVVEVIYDRGKEDFISIDIIKDAFCLED